MQASSEEARRKGLRITLVPTMGYLHAGHASLIRRARRDGDVVVVSLFVNPTQFGPKEDFSSYPRDFERDRKLIEACGGDILFAPSAEEMYPTGFSTNVDVGGLTKNLWGRSRPGHFKGVATIVTKLFASVLPHAAVFGQKDAQQALVIGRFTRDLNLNVEILVAPTVREPDGLARSSRNSYLSEGERRRAPILFHALQEGRRIILDGNLDRESVITSMRSQIERTSGTDIDYVDALDAETLDASPDLGHSTLLAVAVKFREARLIDNVLVHQGRNPVELL